MSIAAAAGFSYKEAMLAEIGTVYDMRYLQLKDTGKIKKEGDID